MFYPARMHKVLIGLHRRHYQAFISALHEAGILEIIEIRDISSQIGPLTSHSVSQSELVSVIKNTASIDRICEVIDQFLDHKSGILAQWFIPDREKRLDGSLGDCVSVSDQAETLIHESEEILSIYTIYNQIREEKEKIEENIRNLSYLLPFNFDIAYLQPSKFCIVIAGIISEKEGKVLLSAIKGSISDSISDSIIKIEKIGDHYTIIGISTRDSEEALLQAFRTSNFQRIELPIDLTGIPSDIIPILKEKLVVKINQEEDLRGSLQKLSRDFSKPLYAMREDLMIWRERLDAARKFGSTREVVFIEGWVADQDTQLLQDLINSHAENESFFSIKEPSLSDQVPIVYNNPKWLKPFELLTSTFATPRYNEIDPTPFLAPAFLIFFGLMLGDAGYGIIITLLAWLLYRGVGQKDKTMHDIAIVLIACGISDIIFGTVQGGWFGDIIPRIFGVNPPFVLIEPIKTPMIFFELALIIGTLHINLGIVLALWQNIKQKAYRIAFQEQIVWFILQPSVAVLLYGFFDWYTVPTLVEITAQTCALFGLIIIFYSKGVMGFFSLTGFLGDWLSYVRILALALATSGIAMTINILTNMIADIHPLMFIPAIIIGVISQIFNLLINTLGSAIHAIRLHYIEFFGKFYVGGGRPFSPFRAEREYTVIRDDEMLT